MQHERHKQADAAADDGQVVESSGTMQNQSNEVAVAEQSGVEPEPDVEAEDNRDLQEIELERVFATADPKLQAACLRQLTTALYVDSDATTTQKMDHAIRLLAMVKDVQPRDGLEAGLIVQMVALHDAAMEEMRRAVTSRMESERQSHLNMALKLTDKYAKLMAALDKRRNGGEQRVKVQHEVKLLPDTELTIGAGVEAIDGEAYDPDREIKVLKRTPAFNLALEQLTASAERKEGMRPKKVRDA